MNRLLHDKLDNWKTNPRRKPLILKGARQVGKTWLIDQFGQNKFDSYIKIDLEKQSQLHSIFKKDLSPSRIIEAIEFNSGSRIIPGSSLLFIDEIQACPRAITALRYFYEEMPELHVIAAGSLLEFALGKTSVPVGRIQYLHLSPMTFYEFLCATKTEVQASSILKNPKELDDSLQLQILSELKNYFFVGGMPECVKTYRDTQSMLETFQVQSQILESYRDDFSKYAPTADKTCLDAVLLSIAQKVGEQIKYVDLDRNHSIPTVHKAFDLLNRAQVVHKIKSANPSGIPLGASVNSKRFKAVFLDIGLMQNLNRIPIEQEWDKLNLADMYRGKLAEQFVAQELAAKSHEDLFYWSRSKRGSTAEIDFLTIHNGVIYPVEVKSGTSGRLKSLHLLLDKYPNCPNGLVLYSGSYSEIPEQRLRFLPLYCAGNLGTILG